MTCRKYSLDCASFEMGEKEEDILRSAEQSSVPLPASTVVLDFPGRKNRRLNLNPVSVVPSRRTAETLRPPRMGNAGDNDMHKVTRWALVASLLCLSACQEQIPTPTVERLPTGTVGPVGPAMAEYGLLGFRWDDRSPFRAGLTSTELGVLERMPGASAYQIDVRIAADMSRLDVIQEARYTNQESEPLSEVYLRLFPRLFGAPMLIHSVLLDGAEAATILELGDSALRLSFPEALQPGEQSVIRIDFQVQVPTEAEGNYGIFGYVDDILALAHFYPMIAVFDDEGWNIEIPPPYGDVVYADSSFYLVQVSAPKAATIVASGVEIARQDDGDVQRVTFAAGPMRDFFVAASTEYALVSRQVGETTVRSYAPAHLSEGAEAALDYTASALRVFGERVGSYPFTELDVVSTPTLALGVEYPGIVAMAIRLYPPVTSYPPEYLESTMAHEVSHQWFYSVVGNDQLDEPWLDEAMAQYATLLYFRDLYGPEGAAGFRSSLEARWDRVERDKIPIGMPVASYTGLEYGAIVYGRGPLFVETLAKRMGEEAFAGFLEDYYDTHKWGIASGSDFRAMAESQCGCDMMALFQEWVYSQ